MNLNEIRAVITGGQSGLGQACVAALQAIGAKVVSWDLKSSQSPYQMECDVSDENSVQQALNQTLSTIGIPNVCIQCAGIAPAKCIVGKEGPQALKDFSKVISVNLLGSFNVMRLVAAEMLKLPLEADKTRGVFILTASVAAMEGQIGQAAYSASKGGIAAMTLPAAREFAKHQIRVNTIAPGLMATPMLYAMPDEVKLELAAQVPFPRRLGRPEEYAALALHMIENDYLNGEIIRLDGAIRMSPG